MGLDERPKYQSILMSGFGAAAVTGPILGGGMLYSFYGGNASSPTLDLSPYPP